MAAAALEVDGLGFAYPGGAWVFRSVGFALEPGRMLAVLGRNGRGKTTLLKTILGLERPRQGVIRRAGRTGYVPQSTGARVSFRLLDMVVMGRARQIGVLRSPRAADYAAAHRALELLGIGDMAERAFLSLSGGERQLGLIARALASECRLLVLDEPAAALDFGNQRTILRLLRRLVAESGLSVVFSTHNPQHAAQIADRALLMIDAEHQIEGPSAEVLSEANLAGLYGLEVRTLALDSGEGPIRAVVPVF